MLDIRRIREDKEGVKASFAARCVEIDLDGILAQDARRRSLLVEVESLKGRRNSVSKEIGALKKAGSDVSDEMQAMRFVGDEIAQLDAEIRDIEMGQRDELLMMPNVPHSSVPVGEDETGNKVIRTVGEPKKFDFEPMDHTAIGERLGILDFARATKMTGTGFPLYVGAGARLERGLIQFMLDTHTKKHGYIEMSPPFVCNASAMTGTGQLPKLADDMYRTEDGMYLVPTAEVPVTNYFRDEIIEDPLPICFTTYTPCFRREAGAAGSDTRGLLRVHQFDKVEMVKFVEPASSYEELESLLSNAEAILTELGLAYRVVELCTGDLSFQAAKCYDLEIWAAGRNDWLEVSSCSNCESFQARRAGIRYRKGDGKVDFVHTLNGSGVALPRLFVAILENYQQPDGSVELPECLVPYMDGVKRLEPRERS